MMQVFPDEACEHQLEQQGPNIIDIVQAELLAFLLYCHDAIHILQCWNYENKQKHRHQPRLIINTPGNIANYTLWTSRSLELHIKRKHKIK